jgi:hypothetical protein
MPIGSDEASMLSSGRQFATAAMLSKEAETEMLIM